MLAYVTDLSIIFNRLWVLVPDLSIHGKLSTLATSLTLEDYKLISGLLSFNIGECVDDLQMIVSIPDTSTVVEDVIILTLFFH